MPTITLHAAPSPFLLCAEAERLEALCHARPWGAADFLAHEERLRREGGEALLTLAGAEPGRADGYLLCSFEAGQAQLDRVGVAPFARRQGLGQLLLAEARRFARARRAELHLVVARDNRAARALYRAAGFAPVGRHPGYYGPGTIGLRLALRRP